MSHIVSLRAGSDCFGPSVLVMPAAVLLIRALPVLLVVPFTKDETGVGPPKAEGIG